MSFYNAEMHQIRFWLGLRGSAVDTAGAVYSAPRYPLAGFKPGVLILSVGARRKGRGKGRRGEGKRKRRKGEGMHPSTEGIQGPGNSSYTPIRLTTDGV